MYRIQIRGWTASFRYPAFISGFQPTLPVPALSTVYGVVSAASGKAVLPSDIALGYVFLSRGKGVDLETIYELSGALKATSNVVKREILFEPELYLYVDQASIAEAFKMPHYPLLLGRSTELAMVAEVREVNLEKRNNVRLGGTVVPFPTKGAYGPIQALPTHFTDEIPRKAVGTKPFYLIDRFINYSTEEILSDPEKDWGVWMYARQNPVGKE